MTFQAETTTPVTTIRVLLTNFRPVYLKALTQLIEQMEGISVLKAVAHGHEAAKEDYVPQPDVVVCGFSLYAPETLEPLRAFRSKLPETWIIATSIDPEGVGQQPAMATGADEYLRG